MQIFNFYMLFNIENLSLLFASVLSAQCFKHQFKSIQRKLLFSQVGYFSTGEACSIECPVLHKHHRIITPPWDLIVCAKYDFSFIL